MSRTCTVCRHPERPALDALLVEGRESFRELAGRYPLSPSALRRHKLDHVPTTLARALESVEVSRADSLLDQVRQLQIRSEAILKRAEVSGDMRTALAAVRELRNIGEVLARMALKQGAVVEVTVVEGYVQKVFDVLCEFVPEERLERATTKLKDSIEAAATLKTCSGGGP
ncbi:MAG: hypothetical protein ABIR79_07760 [Candidatus Binatia bacterium]